MSEKVKVCELCEEQPATVLCAECFKCFCDRCSRLVHELPKKKDHKTEIITKGVRVDAMCPLHKKDHMGMFCVDNIQLCCFGCAFEGQHKGHRVVELSEVNKDNKVFSAVKSERTL